MLNIKEDPPTGLVIRKDSTPPISYSTPTEIRLADIIYLDGIFPPGSKSCDINSRTLSVIVTKTDLLIPEPVISRWHISLSQLFTERRNCINIMETNLHLRPKSLLDIVCQTQDNPRLEQIRTDIFDNPTSLPIPDPNAIYSAQQAADLMG